MDHKALRTFHLAYDTLKKLLFITRLNEYILFITSKFVILCFSFDIHTFIFPTQMRRHLLLCKVQSGLFCFMAGVGGGWI